MKTKTVTFTVEVTVTIPSSHSVNEQGFNDLCKVAIQHPEVIAVRTTVKPEAE